MAQVTLYLRDELAERLRLEARKAGKSLSAYVAELASSEVATERWPKGFARLYGSWLGDFPGIEDDVPEKDVDLR